MLLADNPNFVAVDQKVYHDILKFNFDILKQLP
jgi:hypothetical protein